MTKDRFKFENDNEFDFPFYDDLKSISKSRWAILAIAYIAVIIYLICPIKIPGTYTTPIVVFLVPTLAFAYACNGDFSVIVKKLKKRDIGLLIKTYIANYAYCAVVALILIFIFGIKMNTNVIGGSQISNFLFAISVFFQLFGEELIKIIPFILLLTLFYKFTNNRKNSIIISAVISVLIFGLIHYNAYSGKLIQIILIQGFGSLINLYVYLKTKNIVASYILHLMIDWSAWGLELLGIAGLFLI